MKNAPKTIFLQIGDPTDKEFETEDNDFNSLSQVCWSADRINDNDLEYELNCKSNEAENYKRWEKIFSYWMRSGEQRLSTYLKERYIAPISKRKNK
jgi:hypothetical protein